ncbi:hypothetical protein D3C78_1335280 [compost metagenome]
MFARVKDWALWNKANIGLPLGLAVLAGVASIVLWPGKAPDYVPMFVGLLVGAGLGFRIERQTIDFGVEVAVWKRVLAAVIGSVAFLLFQKGLKAVGAQLPLEPIYWQALRGLSMGLFITLLMPWVLVKLRLLSRHAGEVAAPAKVAAVG